MNSGISQPLIDVQSFLFQGNFGSLYTPVEMESKSQPFCDEISVDSERMEYFRSYFQEDSTEGSTWQNLDLNNLNISGEVPLISSIGTIGDGLIKGLNLDPNTLEELPVGSNLESVQNRQPLNPEAKLFRTAFDWADFFGRD